MHFWCVLSVLCPVLQFFSSKAVSVGLSSKYNKIVFCPVQQCSVFRGGWYRLKFKILYNSQLSGQNFLQSLCFEDPIVKICIIMFNVPSMLYCAYWCITSVACQHSVQCSSAPCSEAAGADSSSKYSTIVRCQAKISYMFIVFMGTLCFAELLVKMCIIMVSSMSLPCYIALIGALPAWRASIPSRRAALRVRRPLLQVQVQNILQ